MGEIALTILAVLTVVLAAALVAIGIPMLVRLSQILRRVDSLLREAELNLGPAMGEVREMMRHLNKASAGVAEGIARTGGAFEAIGELGRTVGKANMVVQAALGPGVAMLTATLAGLKAGGRVLLRRFSRRR